MRASFLKIGLFLIIAAIFAAPVLAQDSPVEETAGIPEMEEAAEIPEILMKDEEYEDLLRQKQKLDNERISLQREINALNAECDNVDSDDADKVEGCRLRFGTINNRISRYEIALQSYSDKIEEIRNRPLPTVNPEDIKGKTQEKGLKIKEVPKPYWDPYTKKYTTAQVLLEAIDKGRIYGKNKPSDIDTSIKFLEGYLDDKNINKAQFMEAISWLEGARKGAEEYGNLGKPEEKSLLDSAKDLTKKIKELGTPKKTEKWPGPKRPQLLESAAGIDEWRQARNNAYNEAVEKGEYDYGKATEYLEKKVKSDKADASSAQALQFIRAYYSYCEYEESRK